MSSTGLSSTVNKVVTYVFGTMVLAAICLQTWGVFSRNVLNASTAWVDDLQRLNFIWLIWIGAALAYGGRGLIGLDLVQSKLVKRPRAYHVMTLVQTLLELTFAGAFSFMSFQIISKQFGSGETTTVLGIPLGVVNLGFALGCWLFLAFAVRKLFRTINDVRLLTPVDEEETKPKEA